MIFVGRRFCFIRKNYGCRRILEDLNFLSGFKKFKNVITKLNPNYIDDQVIPKYHFT